MQGWGAEGTWTHPGRLQFPLSPFQVSSGAGMLRLRGDLFLPPLQMEFGGFLPGDLWGNPGVLQAYASPLPSR